MPEHLFLHMYVNLDLSLVRLAVIKHDDISLQM